VHILHVTPHLPPDQAANALLPAHLGTWALEAGYEVSYAAHPPRSGGAARMAGPVAWIAPVQGDGLTRRLRLASMASAGQIARSVGPIVDRADLIHLHSNGLLTEVVAWLARRRGIPTVLTLYGTEIWHYQPRALLDLFTEMYRGASRVAFYSRRLHDRALELGLRRSDLSVVYPPVTESFAPAADEERRAIRERLGVTRTNLLVNVKRLHRLAGQRHLIDAMPLVLRKHPDTELVICGTGALRDELAGRARDAGVGGHVTLAGLVRNDRVADYNRIADAFVLPSLLEALPTVAVEALACGTPVVSADHPGGLELHELFQDDVRIVPRENSEALAAALVTILDSKRRARPESMATLEREFRPAAVRARYFSLYAEIAGKGP
jgi:glycosyltransferase involved in cell wall biosynthesis